MILLQTSFVAQWSDGPRNWPALRPSKGKRCKRLHKIATCPETVLQRAVLQAFDGGGAAFQLH
jgi:hypothetical protein